MTKKLTLMPSKQAHVYADTIVDTLHALASRQLPQDYDIALVLDLEWLLVRISELREAFDHDASYRIGPVGAKLRFHDI